MKKILVLGSTGSIGTQALEVIFESTELAVAGLAAASSDAVLVEQARRFHVGDVALVDEEAGARTVKALPDARVYTGRDCLKALIDEVDCDLVLNGVVGAAGLKATIATLEKGIDLALANKESLVIGGHLVMEMARQKGITVLPVDSEHSAVFQCLEGQPHDELAQVILTASGGPFFGRKEPELSAVSITDALDHPRWAMGNKITIDSATLMNKGLEIIEAHHLFEIGYNDIDVVIHPQSIVHSLVRFTDGSVVAQLGLPSMKLPIAYALNYPGRRPVTMPQLDLVQQRDLNFYAPDLDAFPCLRLAREAGERGGAAPIVLNAANEVAVAAFLAGKTHFLGIAAIVERALGEMDAASPDTPRSLQDIETIDNEARSRAESLIG